MKKYITFNVWIFATIAFFTLVALRLIAPDVFWDIISAFTTSASAIGGLFK